MYLVIYSLLFWTTNIVGKTAAEGAWTTVYCCVENANNLKGTQNSTLQYSTDKKTLQSQRYTKQYIAVQYRLENSNNLKGIQSSTLQYNTDKNIWKPDNYTYMNCCFEDANKIKCIQNRTLPSSTDKNICKHVKPGNHLLLCWRY